MVAGSMMVERAIHTLLREYEYGHRCNIYSSNMICLTFFSRSPRVPSLYTVYV